MDRPRDIIKSIKCCQPFESQTKLTPTAIKSSMLDYSQWLYNELGNELFRQLPEYRTAMGLLTRIGKGVFTLDMWRGEFGKSDDLVAKYNADKVLEILYNFSVIGMLRQERWFFRYKTPQVTFDKGASFIVHYGIQKALVIPGSYPRVD
jgi:hypothetical protein